MSLSEYEEVGELQLDIKTCSTFYDHRRQMIFTELDKEKILSFNHNYAGWDHVRKAVNGISNSRLRIAKSPNLTPEELAITWNHSSARKSLKCCDQLTIMKARKSELENEFGTFKIYKKKFVECKCMLPGNIVQTIEEHQQIEVNCAKDDLKRFSNNHLYIHLFKGECPDEVCCHETYHFL